eukprot:TRINITY_DN92859_c0_g1_i1.p1 TRINITY_DN92859_c0_g1~~TRINITY_DN92859_c0_g1_i1.p1  ORF type:complete len:405 (+),score=76.25 TRINITY_DN92859_c0_g1_i1:39-1217(+)
MATARRCAPSTPEASDEEAGADVLAKSLRVKNTFIDVQLTPPSPLHLQKHESCPAALAPSLADSLAKASECSEVDAWRVNGEALEVQLDESSQVGHARIKAAEVLGVSPCCVRLVDRAGQCVEDDAFMCELWTDDLRIDVVGEADVRHKQMAYQLTHAMSKAGDDDDSTVLECLDSLRIQTQDDMFFAVKFIIAWALREGPPSFDTYADIILALRKRHPTFESGDATQATSFNRIIRTVCQEEYDALMNNEAQQTSIPSLHWYLSGNSDSSQRRQGSMPALISLLCKLYGRRLLVLKVMEQVMQDLLWPISGDPEPTHVKCACQLVEAVYLSTGMTKKEEALIARVLDRLDHLKNSTGTNRLPLYTGNVSLRIESVLHTCARLCAESASQSK